MSESSPLFTPPKFFKEVVFHRHTDRAVTWLELFYDLVYVATFIQIGNFLSDNLTWLGFAHFLVMLTVVWWSWTGETFYQNRYPVDDVWHRLLVFVQIFAVASMGLSVSAAFGDLYIQFTLANIVTRLMLLLMYYRSMKKHPASADLSRGRMSANVTGTAIWIASLFLPYEYHWVGWLIAVAVELGLPFLPKMRIAQQKWGSDLHHISERFGILTIIVLGESFVKVLDDAQGTQIGLEQLLFSTFGLTVLYSLWWLYFSDTAGKLIDFSHPYKSYAWVYGHLPLAAGLIAFGVGAKKLYGTTIDYTWAVPDEKYRLLYTASIVLYLLALALIDIGLDNDETHTEQRRETILHIIAAVLVGIIGLTMTGVTTVLFVAMIAVVMSLQVADSIYQTSKADHDSENVGFNTASAD